jgi:hypothetical protein
LDTVNQPKHYKKDVSSLEIAVRAALTDNGDIDPLNLECFEALVSMLTIEEIRGYLRGNSFKYRWRYRYKNNIEDLKKAEWYEKKLLRLEEVMTNYFNLEVK